MQGGTHVNGLRQGLLDAMREFCEYRNILPRGVKLGLNISPAHLQADSFRDDMLRFAAALPADHFHVVLEVTERAMIDKEKSMANFAWLHRQGFEIAIDDFGTGHSALIYLER
ncbi:EAL domain-containing protein, partial [Pseudomonas aeruginosa]|nr:EAL domain-containing protein [Pseudomonas aeruginosa]